MVRGWVSGLVVGGLVGVTGLSVVSLVSAPKAQGRQQQAPQLDTASAGMPVAEAPVASVPQAAAEPVPQATAEPIAQDPVPNVPEPNVPEPNVPEPNVPEPQAAAPAPPDVPVPGLTVPPTAPLPEAAQADLPATSAASVPPGASAVAPAAPVVPTDGAVVPQTALATGQAAPASDSSAAVLPAPLLPAAGAESPPVVADLPALPPLTAEEEALLKRLGDGSADAAPEVTDPAPLPDIAVAEPAPEQVLPPPQPDSAQPDSAQPDSPQSDSPQSDSPQPDSLQPAAPEPVLPEPAAPAPGPATDEAEAPFAGGDAGPLPDPALAPVAGLGGAVEGVTSGRLPRIGDAAQPEAQAESADARPLVQFARSFENPGQKPLYAIILLDSGGPEIDREALARLPFAVSFALDPLDPAAAANAAIYRAGGQEVLMLATGIPSGAQAQDLEVAFGVMGDAVPEAVAVLDTAAGAFQGDRPLASLVVPLVAAQGRGLVTWDRGLNAADQVARREAVPAAVAFRSLDAEGESAPVIRRYLDRAAFKAAQEGRVTVIGSTRPETIAALLEWAVEGRSATVALAPVSAVLTVE